MSEPLVVVHHAGSTTSLVRAREHSFSVLGGPVELDVSGVKFEHSLHQIAFLNHNQLAVLGPPRYIFDLPLLYGMRYSGCTMKYRFELGKVLVEQLSPQAPDENWPYRDYPSLLPCYPLDVGKVEQESYQAFARRAPNLPEDEPSELIVLVPPPANLGFSLWGRGGDAEGVTLVFECNLASRSVVAYNVCS